MGINFSHKLVCCLPARLSTTSAFAVFAGHAALRLCVDQRRHRWRSFVGRMPTIKAYPKQSARALQGRESMCGRQASSRSVKSIVAKYIRLRLHAWKMPFAGAVSAGCQHDTAMVSTGGEGIPRGNGGRLVRPRRGRYVGSLAYEPACIKCWSCASRTATRQAWNGEVETP